MSNSLWPISSCVKQDYKISECIKEVNAKNACTLYHDPKTLPINNNPIEKNLHYIWIKSHQVSTNSNEISELDLNNFLYTPNNYIIDRTKESLNIDFHLNNKQSFTCASGNYFDYNKEDLLHKIFWINDEALYPNTIATLKSFNVDIRNINALKDLVPNIDLVHSNIDNKKYGAMIDYLKYEVVKNFGGVALDLNFNIITTKLSQLLDAYSFIGATTQKRGEITSENYFLAAHAKHPILNAMSDFLNTELTLERKLHTVTTWGQWDRVIRENIDGDGEINEVFIQAGKICGENGSMDLHIGWDPTEGGKSWYTEEQDAFG